MPQRGGLARLIRRANLDGEFLNFFFFDVCFGLAIGVLIWLFTASSLTSLTIGLIAGIIPLIVELRLQSSEIRRHIRTEIEMMRKQVEILNGAVLALHLEKLTVRAPHESFEALHKLVESYSHIVESDDRLFMPRASELLRKWAEEMVHLDREYMELWTPADIHHQTMECLRSATTRVFATSYVKIADFWSGGQGAEYRNENLARAAAGVHMDRVFIFDSPSDATPLIREIIKEQAAAKINVRIAWITDLKPQWRDMAIFDKAYVEYLDVRIGSLEVRKATVHRSSEKLRQAEELMEHIMINSREALSVLDEIDRKRMPSNQRRPGRESSKLKGKVQKSR